MRVRMKLGHVNMHNSPYIDRYLNNDWQLEMLLGANTMYIKLDKCKNVYLFFQYEFILQM